MKLKSKLFKIGGGGNFIVALNKNMIKEFSIVAGDRIRVMSARKYIVATINIADDLKDDEIGILSEVRKELDIDEGELVEVSPEEKPKSILAIRKKMDKIELMDEEIKDIITDMVDNKLTGAEIASFVCAVYINGLSIRETVSMARATAETGEMIRHPENNIILDKHCAGGVPGNRTTMLVVPIVTSTGLKMPKTSSRAITSPAGTADVMEVLANVCFSADEIKSITNRLNGCIVWGGGVNIAPADDIMIKVEQPLGIDPTSMLISSILAKKYAAGAKKALVDLPYGPGTKMSLSDAKKLRKTFVVIGNELGIEVKTIETDGSKPIGRGIGPVLEAKDVLLVLENSKDAPKDLVDKATMMSGLLLEMGGKAKKGQGKKMAEKILKSKKAHEQMMKIISAQNGNPDVKSSDLNPGKYYDHLLAHQSGKITEVKNHEIQHLARVLGCPFDKKAGMYLYHTVGDKVKIGDKLCTFYAESQRKLEATTSLLATHNPYVIRSSNSKKQKIKTKKPAKKKVAKK